MSGELAAEEQGPAQAGSTAEPLEAVRQALSDAFDIVRGAGCLAMWASENPGPFYALLARLVPGGEAAVAAALAQVTDTPLSPRPLTADEWSSRIA